MFILLDTLGYVPTTGYSMICSYYWILYDMFLLLDPLGYVPTTGYSSICPYYWIF